MPTYPLLSACNLVCALDPYRCPSITVKVMCVVVGCSVSVPFRRVLVFASCRVSVSWFRCSFFFLLSLYME